MENVWLHTRGDLWDPIIQQFKAEKYWGTVVRRARQPSWEEVKTLKKQVPLPADLLNDSETCYESLLTQSYMIFDMLYRITDWGTEHYNSASYHELLYRTRIYFEFYLRALIKEQISLVIFWHTPHMGWDYILYRVAKFLQIRTLILEQSRFPNRFFHFFEFDDYGDFQTSKKLENLPSYPIEKKVEKDWFFMQKDWKRTRFTPKKLLNFKKIYQRANRIIDRTDALMLLRDLCSSQRRSQAFFRYYVQKNYKHLFRLYCEKTCNLHRKFVYFPLGYQPEKSTTSWGGVYVDQVLAIEKLSRLIPRDWYIYVKENPKQRGAYRNELFFKRLAQIPNTRLLAKDADTFALTKRAQFVATVVGTAAWEAITGGKNALVFGNGAWYQTLPGIFRFSSNLNHEDLLAHEIDHDLLQKRVADLVNKCGTGVVYYAFIPSIDNFSLEENTKSVVTSLKRILYDAPPIQ